MAKAGGIDVSFNLVTHGDVQGTPLAEMDLEGYIRPVETAVSDVSDCARGRAT